MPFAHCRNLKKDCSVNPHPQPFSQWEKGERLKSVTDRLAILRFKLRTLTQPLPKGEETCASLTPVSSLGGSIKDDESIAAANENGIAMAFTGIRHFKH